MLYYTIIGLTILSVLIWIYTIRPMYSLARDLTVNIREEIIPDIQKFLNLLTTLSSASVILTFSFLQTFSDKVIVYKEFLVGSWVFFGVSILMGVTAVNFIFIYRAQLKVMVKKAWDHINLNNELKEKAENIDDIDKCQDKEFKEKIEALKKIKPAESLKIMKKTQNRLFLVIFIASASFFNAIALLTIFAVTNV